MRWIQTRHRLPEKGKQVIVYRPKWKVSELSELNADNKFTYVEDCCYGNTVEFGEEDISHWAYLPEEPK